MVSAKIEAMAKFRDRLLSAEITYRGPHIITIRES